MTIKTLGFSLAFLNKSRTSDSRSGDSCTSATSGCSTLSAASSVYTASDHSGGSSLFSARLYLAQASRFTPTRNAL